MSLRINGVCMRVARLRKILDNIDAGKPINLNFFLQSINSLNLRDRIHSDDIRSSKVKGDKYRVEYIKPSLMASLRNYVGNGQESRITAASQNQSHSQKVIGSYLNIVLSAHENDKAYPVFVSFDIEGRVSYPPNTSITRTGSCDLLIIENVQLFLFWQRTVSFLRARCGFNSTSFDIALGRGNEISNTYHKQFLSKYQTIYLCLDIDLGGLMIAKNLISLVPDTPYQFLMPDNIDNYLSKVVEQIDLKTLNDIRAIGLQYSGLFIAARTISKHIKTIEQESFLHD